MLTSQMIKEKARELGATLCGIGKVYDEPNKGKDPYMILPSAKCIIGFGFAVPKGLYKAMEHGNHYYAYANIGVKHTDEEAAEIFLLKMGASGLKNPFMPPDAYADFEDRIAIIAGEAEISPEKAKKIIANTYFYPPSHQYPSSICGRACDVACYVHLEEKGVLTKKFKTPFRKRTPWKFNIKDFE